MSSDKNQSDKTKNPNAYLKYSGMVFQLFALLFIAAFAGQKIDAWLGNKTAYVTALLLCIAVLGYLLKIYFELIKNP